MHPPQAVKWFELSLYAALTLDALSIVFSDHSAMTLPEALTASAIILLQVDFVWLSAQQRLGVATIGPGSVPDPRHFSLAQTMAQQSLDIGSAIEGVSCAMTVAGLCFAFSRSTYNWFSE